MTRVITGSDGRKYLTDEPLLHPPKREWVGLTDDEINYFCHLAYTGDEEFLLAVQAKLKEKNNG